MVINHLVKKFNQKNKNVYLIGPIEIPRIDFPSILSREIAFKKTQNVASYKSRKNFDQNYSKPIKYYKKKPYINYAYCPAT